MSGVAILCPKARKGAMETAISAVMGSPCVMMRGASPSGNPHAAYTHCAMFFGSLPGALATAVYNAAVGVPGGKAAITDDFGAFSAGENVALSAFNTPQEALDGRPT